MRVRPGGVARYVLMPGDPARVELIAKHWDEAWEVSHHREFKLWMGRTSRTSLSACSTGIGAPSAVIALEELARAGADTFIRVGSTGAIQPGIELGDLIISEASIRLEGTTSQYTYPGYPAYASYEVTMALIEAAEELGARYHVGVSASTDSFYAGQGRPGYGGYTWSYSEGLIGDLRKMRVMNIEMENSAIFTVASLYGLRAGSICAVFANRVEGKFGSQGEEALASVAVRAVEILSRWDELKKKHGKKRLYPSLIARG